MTTKHLPTYQPTPTELFAASTLVTMRGQAVLPFRPKPANPGWPDLTLDALGDIVYTNTRTALRWAEWLVLSGLSGLYGGVTRGSAVVVPSSFASGGGSTGQAQRVAAGGGAGGFSYGYTYLPDSAFVDAPATKPPTKACDCGSSDHDPTHYSWCRTNASR